MHEDAFGNITHTFTAEGPFDELGVQVEGEIDVQDTGGIVRNAIERFPRASIYAPPRSPRPTARLSTSRATRGAARRYAGCPARVARPYSRRDEIRHRPDPYGDHGDEAFALKRGVCQDLTHVFLAAARYLDIPARYVGGYFHRADGIVQQDAGHAWAEAYVPAIGWVAFDPANGICATDAHVRVAVGLDYLGAAPVRGRGAAAAPKAWP